MLHISHTHQYIQHGNTSVLLHSIAVAYYSYYLSWYFHLNFRERELVRGALLHDYFLYDWHNSGEGHTFHAFTHARDAFVNAQKEFELSRIEREVIKKHMFPLTPVPPLCREGLMVCLVDKGIVAPGFDSPGGAVQYFHPITIRESIKRGLLERL